MKSQDVRKGVACGGVHGVYRDGRVVRRAQGCWGGQLLVASGASGRTPITPGQCARNVQCTGMAARRRAHVDIFTDVGRDGPFDFSFWCFIFGVFIFVSRVCVFLTVASLFLFRLARYFWAHLLSTINLDLRPSPVHISLMVFHLEFNL